MRHKEGHSGLQSTQIQCSCGPSTVT